MPLHEPSPRLRNADLAPAQQRRWGAFSIFNVWTSDVHSLWGYYLAASLFLLCGSFVNFLVVIGLSSLVIYALMKLMGYAGEKTGVPYPVLVRVSFGVWGANLPALVRCCWPAFGMARKLRPLPGCWWRCTKTRTCSATRGCKWPAMC